MLFVYRSTRVVDPSIMISVIIFDAKYLGNRETAGSYLLEVYRKVRRRSWMVTLAMISRDHMMS